MDAESEELLAEFKKLQMEANGLSQRLQTTTSTLGFSTEAMLLRQVLEELKSVKSEVMEMKMEQENFSNNLTDIREELLNIRECINVQIEVKIEEVKEALNTEKEDVQVIRTKVENIDEKLENVRESLTGQANEHYEMLIENFLSVREKLDDKHHLEQVENIVERVEKLQHDVENVENTKRRAQLIENDQSDTGPILESIIGSWRYSGEINSDEFLEKCSEKERKWFESKLKVEVTGRRIAMSYPNGPAWTHQIGDPHPRTNLLDNHLIFVYENVIEVFRTDDFSMKDGKLIRKEMALGVEFQRFYERV